MSSQTPKRTLVITGVSSGIGRATATLFLQKGWKVIGIARRTQRISFPKNRGEFVALEADLRDISAIPHLAKKVAQETSQIDLLVNCAGEGFGTPLDTLTVDTYERIFDLNVRSIVFFTQALLPLLRDGVATVCNLSSIAGIRGFSEWSIYCASKHAVEGFSSSLRHELRSRRVRVTCIQPGSVDTAFYESLRDEEKMEFMQPETVARAIFLLTELDKNATIETLFLNNTAGDL